MKATVLQKMGTADVTPLLKPTDIPEFFADRNEYDRWHAAKEREDIQWKAKNKGKDFASVFLLVIALTRLPAHIRKFMNTTDCPISVWLVQVTNMNTTC